MTIHYTSEEIQAIDRQSDFALDPDGRMLLFVGHAHSGHSLIGALLDAHPQVCLANEVNVVKLVQEHGLNAVQIEKVLMHAYGNNSKGWKNSAYLYNIDAGSQGSSEAPLVLGDKKAGGSTRIFFNHPDLYERLLGLYGKRLRIIFVRRDPVDIVAAYAHYMQQEPSMFHVNRYNENKATVNRLQALTPQEQWLTMDQQDFVNQPLEHMLRAFEFLGIDVEPIEDQVKDWVSVVRKDIPGKSASIHISKELRSAIKQ